MATTSTSATEMALVYEQFKRVRNVGKVNMLDMNGVIQEASRLQCNHVVRHLVDIQAIRSQSDRSKAYMAFLEGFPG